jgi:hypothetical protein
LPPPLGFLWCGFALKMQIYMFFFRKIHK